MGRHAQSRKRRAKWLEVTGLATLLLLLGGAAIAGPAIFGSSPDEDKETSSAPSEEPTPEETPTLTPEPSDLPTPTELPAAEFVDRELLSEVRKDREEADTLPTLTFRMASFNVLGHSHTTPGGNKPSFADGRTRINWTVDLLRGQGIDVAGLQEYEPIQHHAFVAKVGGSYAVYPGLQIGNNAVRNSVVWNTAEWEAVETRTIDIPYFRGNLVPMPYVLLKHKETGRQAWFINIHNPVSSKKRGNNDHWRTVATQKQVALMAQLRSEDTPVFLMGDFNERGEAFCKVTAGGQAVAANGGSGGPPCSVPGGAGIDWIFSTPDVAFSGYQRFQSDVVRRISDHPMILASATLSDD